MYAIQKYVVEIMKEKGLRKSDVARKVGYKNIAKGCRRLHEFLNDLQCNSMVVDNLHVALDVPREEINEKLKETQCELEEERRQQEERERREFVPFLYCNTERRIPSPIFVCAILGSDRMKYIKLAPDFNDQSPERQKHIIKAFIEDRLKRLEEFGGSIPAFGKVISFSLQRYYDYEESDIEVYDLKGELIPDPPEGARNVATGKATLTLKGKDITWLFKKWEDEKALH